MNDLYQIPDGLNPEQEKPFRKLAESHKGLVDRFQTVQGLVKIPPGGSGGQNGTVSRPARSKDSPSPLKSIRKFCMKCKGAHEDDQKPWKMVRECKAVTCPLHPFRMGKNPFHGLHSNSNGKNLDTAFKKSIQTLPKTK